MGPRAASLSLKSPVVLWSLMVSDCLCAARRARARAHAAASIAAAAAERRDLRCSSFYHRAYIVIMNYESAGVDRSSLSLFPFSTYVIPPRPARSRAALATVDAARWT
jgi:hypothetical protein